MESYNMVWTAARPRGGRSVMGGRGRGRGWMGTGSWRGEFGRGMARGYAPWRMQRGRGNWRGRGAGGWRGGAATEFAPAENVNYRQRKFAENDIRTILAREEEARRVKEQAVEEVERKILLTDVAKRVGNHIETIWVKLNAGRVVGFCDMCGGNFEDNEHWGNAGRRCYTRLMLLDVKGRVKERIESGDLPGAEEIISRQCPEGMVASAIGTLRGMPGKCMADWRTKALKTSLQMEMGHRRRGPRKRAREVMRAPSIDPAKLPMTVVAAARAKVQRKGMGQGKEVVDNKIKERKQSGGARKERVVKKRWEGEEELENKAEEKARVKEWKPRKGKMEGVVRHYEAVIPVELAEKVRKELEEEGDLEWHTGKWRRVIHEGDEGAEYAYAGKKYKTGPWTKAVAEMKGEVNRRFGTDCNLVVVNHYRNGGDVLGSDIVSV